MSKRKGKVYEILYSPKKDITLYELAQALPITTYLISGGSDLNRVVKSNAFKKTKKHFLITRGINND